MKRELKLPDAGLCSGNMTTMESTEADDRLFKGHLHIDTSAGVSECSGEGRGQHLLVGVSVG